jgi:hypothetical protein
MPRLRNKDTGAVVNVSDVTAALLDKRVWGPAEKPAAKAPAPVKRPPVKRAARKPAKKAVAKKAAVSKSE